MINYVEALEKRVKKFENQSHSQSHSQSQSGQGNFGQGGELPKESSKILSIGKDAFYKQLEMDLEQAYKYTSEIMTKNMLELDAKEGIDAFIKKRTPQWKE